MVEFYPGSKTPIETFEEPEYLNDGFGFEAWLPEEPYDYGIPGDPRAELYTIGALASVLGRSPVTIRAWEDKGWIPMPQWTNSYSSVNARRRLYTREQLESMFRIAAEEGMFSGRPITKTNFTERVIRQWAENHWYNDEED